MAPGDVKQYAEAISRIADMFSLASLVPVILEARHGSSHRFRPKPPQQKKPDGTAGEESAQKPSELVAKEQTISPLGIPSALLFIGAQLVACSDIFFYPTTGKTTKSKSKSGVPGPFGVLINGVAKGLKGSKTTGGTLEKASAVVAEALNPAEAFATAHALMMLVALSVTTVSLLGTSLKSLPKILERGPRYILRILALVAAVAMFVACHAEAFEKLWRAVANDQILGTLAVPLRVAALLAASRPRPENEEQDKPQGTPTMFATLQCASLAATLSTGIASGELAKAIAPFTQKSFLAAAWDGQMLSVFAPILLALVWVSWHHLQKQPTHMTLAALLSCVSSPAFLSMAWPKFAVYFGLKNPAEFEKGLLQFLSLTYAAGGVSLFVTGGTSTLIAMMFIGQLIVKIYGLETLTAIFA